jgi:hypothetical protein
MTQGTARHEDEGQEVSAHDAPSPILKPAAAKAEEHRVAVSKAGLCQLSGCLSLPLLRKSLPYLQLISGERNLTPHAGSLTAESSSSFAIRRMQLIQFFSYVLVRLLSMYLLLLLLLCK